MWLSEEIPKLEANPLEASTFQVKLKKREGYSFCTGQSFVYLPFSAACIQAVNGEFPRRKPDAAPQGSKGPQDPKISPVVISSTDNLGPSIGEQNSADGAQMS